MTDVFLWVMLRKMAMNEPPLNSRLPYPCLEIFIFTIVGRLHPKPLRHMIQPHERKYKFANN